eukprot:TRINITY_DN12249_c0_g2_i1.p1 TRINITY_DN12249_c0_g2~~TRINITY_DN12249_c0_g2_i1.p1  ORF type:complete len:356 (-),score=51.35 TRINITY_DN12249_c0_g2_i1:94-1161(-)
MSYNGRVPIHGCVTSKRDRTRTKIEQQKLIQRKQIEEEREKALRQSQEEVANFLKKKKKNPSAEDHESDYRGAYRSQEDTYSRGLADRDERRRERHSRRRSPSPYRSDSGGADRRETRRRQNSSDDERPRRGAPSSARHQRRDVEDMESEKYEPPKREFERTRSPRRDSTQEADKGDEGGWQSSVREPVMSASSRESVREQRSPPRAKFSVPALEESRQAKLAGAFVTTEADTEEDATEKRRVAEMKRKREAEEKARRSKLAKAFAFGGDDEDDQRDHEIAAAAKRAAAKRQLSAGSSSYSSSAITPAAATNMDMCTALKKIADFKRSCNGAAKPMPPELQALAAMMAARGGDPR